VGQEVVHEGSDDEEATDTRSITSHALIDQYRLQERVQWRNSYGGGRARTVDTLSRQCPPFQKRVPVVGRSVPCWTPHATRRIVAVRNRAIWTSE